MTAADWRPIETAPVGFDDVLMFGRYDDGEPVYLVRCPEQLSFEGTTWLGGTLVTPTHWAPLPAPPA